jgi:hypothetical protein
MQLAMAISATLLAVPASAVRLAQYVRIFDAQTTDTTANINLQQVHVYGKHCHTASPQSRTLIRVHPSDSIEDPPHTTSHRTSR